MQKTLNTGQWESTQKLKPQLQINFTWQNQQISQQFVWGLGEYK